MKVIIISDIHGNLETLNNALEYIDKLEVDKCVVYLGYIVVYGPDPEECFNLVTSITDKICLGNHEDAVLDTDYDYQINMYAREAIKWTRNILNEEIKNVITELPLKITEGNVLYVYASPDDPMLWKYITNYRNAYSSLIEMKHTLYFVGHSLIPGVYSYQKTERDDKEVAISRKGRTINPVTVLHCCHLQYLTKVTGTWR